MESGALMTQDHGDGEERQDALLSCAKGNGCEDKFMQNA